MKHRLLLSTFVASFATNLQAINTDTVGAALEYPASCSNHDCTLEFGVVSYDGPAAHFLTRGYNLPGSLGSIPGPILRVAAGNTLSLKLVNKLQDVDNGGLMNNYRSPNTTNLHTHGLHVSSVSPADDVFTEVEPQEEFQYQIPIPAFHMGGTHWYSLLAKKNLKAACLNPLWTTGTQVPSARARVHSAAGWRGCCGHAHCCRRQRRSSS
jgi:hypothetical protein